MDDQSIKVLVTGINKFETHVLYFPCIISKHISSVAQDGFTKIKNLLTHNTKKKRTQLIETILFPTISLIIIISNSFRPKIK